MDSTTILAIPAMPVLPVMPVLPGSILEVFFTRFMPGFYSPAAGPPSGFFLLLQFSPGFMPVPDPP